MSTLLGIIAIFLFLLGFVLIYRAFRAPMEDRAKFFRAGVGAMAAGAGNALMMREQTAALLLLLIGVMLIFTGATGARRNI